MLFLTTLFLSSLFASRQMNRNQIELIFSIAAIIIYFLVAKRYNLSFLDNRMIILYLVVGGIFFLISRRYEFFTANVVGKIKKGWSCHQLCDMENPGLMNYCEQDDDLHGNECEVFHQCLEGCENQQADINNDEETASGMFLPISSGGQYAKLKTAGVL